MRCGAACVWRTPGVFLQECDQLVRFRDRLQASCPSCKSVWTSSEQIGPVLLRSALARLRSCAEDGRPIALVEAVGRREELLGDGGELGSRREFAAAAPRPAATGARAGTTTTARAARDEHGASAEMKNEALSATGLASSFCSWVRSNCGTSSSADPASAHRDMGRPRCRSDTAGCLAEGGETRRR